jgi:cell wall assembly regulator SMI1
METTDNKRIIETILKLDSQIARTRPKYYQALKEPLNDLEINALEEKYKIKVPTDLRLLYKWKNGQSHNSFESFVNNSMFIQLEETLEIAAQNTSMIGSDFEMKNWWNEKWLPIFHNGGGDYICYDQDGTFTGNKGQLIEFWHSDNDRNVLSPSLETLISKLNHYYEITEQKDFDEYFEIENIDNYPKGFIVE